MNETKLNIIFKSLLLIIIIIIIKLFLYLYSMPHTNELIRQMLKQTALSRS